MTEYTAGWIVWSPDRSVDMRVSGRGIVSYKGKEYDVTVLGVGTPGATSLVSYVQYNGTPQGLAGTSVGFGFAMVLGIGISVSGSGVVGSAEVGLGGWVSVTQTYVTPRTDPILSLTTGPIAPPAINPYDLGTATAVIYAQQTGNPLPAYRDYPIELISGGSKLPPSLTVGPIAPPAINPYDLGAATAVIYAQQTGNPLPSYRDYPIELINGGPKLPPSSPVPVTHVSEPPNIQQQRGGSQPSFRQSENDSMSRLRDYEKHTQSGTSQTSGGLSPTERDERNATARARSIPQSYAGQERSPSKPSSYRSNIQDQRREQTETRTSSRPALKDNQNTASYGGSWGQRSPILLDLSGDGLSVETLSTSSKFLDLDGDGYQHRTAWAGTGTGVLIIDANGDGKISQSNEFAFTEWDSSATSDLEALKHIFDTNGDGKLDAGDGQWLKFRVEVDGQLVTLDSLGITSIDLTPKGSGQTFEDGSAITGTTTFTRADGTTGTVGDAKLANDDTAYIVKTTSVTKTDSSVEKTILAYNKDGSLAFRNIVTTSADGKSVQTQFDDDGNGTFDRSQTNVLTVDASGVQTKVVSNFKADGSLADRTTTVTSADYLTVTTTLDQDGDGIINQRQTYVQAAADGSTTTTTEQLSVDGTLLSKILVGSSADGLTKTTNLDLDGNRVYDDIVTETTTVAADGARNKATVNHSANDDVLSTVYTSTSADGRTISVETDADGNGNAETRTVTISTVAVSGDVTLQTSTYNTDASSTLRSTATTVTTANGLSKTVTSDVNGDGVIDFTDSDVTVVDASGNHTQTVERRSGNNTLLSQTVTTTSADGKSITITADTNGDGKNDSLTTILVGTDGKTTNTATALNFDTSMVGKAVSTTTADGLSKTTSTDANGDNVNELVVDDVITTEGNGSRTETVTSKNANGATIATTITNTSADSLTQTVKTDADGNGVFEETTTDLIVLDGTGKRTETVSSTSANGTLNAQTITDVSADRRTTTVTTDADGDGKIDTRQVKVTASNGSVTTTETAYTPNDTVTGTTRSTVTVSGNGLTTTTSVDLNRDSLADRIAADQTVLNADGSKTRTISLTSSNATLLDTKSIVTSGNGKSITTSEDLNGDGVVDTMATDVTTFDSDGKQFQTVSDYRGTTLVGMTKVTTNLNGLDGSTDYDLDGDGTVNRTSSWKTTPLDPGGSTIKTETVRTADVNATLLSQTITTVSADKKTTTVSSKIDGDAVVDRLETITLDNAGMQKDEVKQYNAAGTLESQSQVTVTDDGLTKTSSSDLDGNGVFELITADVTALNADGSRTQTVSKTGIGNALISRTTANVSASGLTKTVSWFNASGTVVRSMNDVTSLDADGGTTETLSYFKTGGALESKTVTTVAAHGLSSTVTIDVDGNTTVDKKTVTTKQADGSTVQTFSDFGANAVLKDKKTVTTSADGLTQNTEYDSDGNGTVDKKTTSTTVLNANGSKTTRTDDIVAGVTKYITLTDVSGDGLTTITKWDTTGTGGGTTFGKSRTDVTVLNADGSKTQTVSNFTGTTLTSRTLVTTSANGLSVTTQIDPAGAGSYSQTSTEVTVLNADGTKTQTVESKKADGSLISRTIVTTNPNGLIVGSGEERTGFTNQTVTDTTTVLADGAVRETVETKDSGTLLGKVVTLTSADKLSITVNRDGNGDGKFDQRQETATANSGVQTSVTTNFKADGTTVRDKSTVVVSADGRLTTTTWDLDGNGTSDRQRVTNLTSNADGSSTSVISDTTLPGGTLAAKTTIQTSADGKLTTTSTDTNGDNTVDQVETATIDATGASVSVVTNNATARATSNLTSGVVYWKQAIAATIETTTSADGRTEVAKYDYDGNGVYETVMQSTIQVNGSVVTTVTETGTTPSKGTIATSADGLVTTLSKDTDNNGSIDHIETAVTHADGSITLSKKDANAIKQTVVDEVRSTGTLASRITTDLGGLNWSYSEETYDSWGRLASNNVVYDDNTRLAYTFDVTNTNSWWKLQYSYTGTTLVWLRQFWDDGTLTHRQYDYNPNNNYWQIANDEYADGTLIQQTKYFDNGNYDVTRNGVTYHYNASGKKIGPVLLDLDGDGHVDLRPIDLTNMVASPTFDWDGDGVRDPTAWVGQSDGFLSIDLAADGTAGPDGVIDQTKELAFSLWAEQDGAAGSISDLDGVRLVFDTNHDNVLNADDERWNEFRVWRDANQDGLTDQGELLTMTDAGIKLINLMPTTDGSQAFTDGSVITGTSSYETLDGSKYLVADASLNYRPINAA